MAKQKFYIKERHNPQLGVYYVKMGQMSVKEAKANERSIYGTNYMRPYPNEAEYNAAVAQLESEGHKLS